MKWEHRMTDEMTHPAAPLPPALAAIPAERVLELDVREDLRQGREPFSRIMEAVGGVPADGALRLRAIFEPAPLYRVLGRQGFEHHTEQLAPDDWQVWFYRAPVAEEAAAAAVPAADTADCAEGTHVIDVRGLEPPEPMLRTLEALATMPAGDTLVQINNRVPQFLLPMLHERGFTYEIREQDADLVRLFIRREQQS